MVGYIALTISLFIASPPANPDAEARPAAPSPLPAGDTTLQLDRLFKGYDACFVVVDLRSGDRARYHPDRCAKRFSPCSTFKIPNALIGLETGVVSGPDHPFKWDGTMHRRKECNRDHTLRSALRESIVWCFQKVAVGVGAERMQKWLDDIHYGNRDISGGITQFWLGNSLEISADEQVAFLKELQRESLPISRRSQRTVKEMLVLERTSDYTLRGKTGSRADDTREHGILGWFVGSIETPSSTWVFACNISAPDQATGAKARKLSRAALESLKILPPKSDAAQRPSRKSTVPTPSTTDSPRK